ncbi:EF-hand domain-containing family member C2 [Rhinatrema bivittatum]|uniref:EF-hand domain-containing family member C2 n=1 Tax=Rhinatrema bivittatum TaxID=194408 RepID=UPI00112D2883|nr:EF-hand domain-containing family member C2 [Rhinatrema bivittatum]
MALPLLPGNSFNVNLGKEKFHKSQHFGFTNRIPKWVGEAKPSIGGEPLGGQKLPPKHSVFPRGVGSDSPSWVAFDKQVLSFDAYFTEEIISSSQEAYRVRLCKIYFYLEDDTIQVVEPEVKNSGIPQGTIIRRHRIPLPPPNDEEFYTMEHFNINKEIVFYAKPYMIIDCDQFTRNFLRKLGVRINLAGSIPVDPYTTSRNKMYEFMKPLRPYDPMDTLRQFLAHDRHVLRFYGMWDDRESLFGDLRELIVHYFLADDTVEVLEVRKSNSGRDNAPVLIHRMKLPKHAPVDLPRPGQVSSHTILNVFGPMGHGGRHLLDRLETGALHQEFYKDCDFRIGAVINAWGRKILLCDCDEFTKDYYKNKYGIEDFTPILYKASPSEKTERKFPPYTGFGSEEDSLCSCLGMVPKPPQKDFKKFIEKDRSGLESHELRYLARLISDNPIDKDRKFIISYFLSDDTIQVYEPPQRNSGVIGGKFLERIRIMKPGQELFKSEMSVYFTAQDLFVGATVNFFGHIFHLMDADEYAFIYMENNAMEFPVANINIILNKLKTKGEPRSREIKQMFAASDIEKTNKIGYEQFRNLLLTVSEGTLSEHEIMTVARFYSVQEDSEVDVNFLLALAQDQLKRNTFEDFSKLKDSFMYSDREKNGLLSVQESRTIFKAFKVPIADDLLRNILMKHGNDQGQIDYMKLLTGLNWREHPIRITQATEIPVKCEEDWSGQPVTHAVKDVCYLMLLEDLFGLEK